MDFHYQEPWFLNSFFDNAILTFFMIVPSFWSSLPISLPKEMEVALTRYLLQQLPEKDKHRHRVSDFSALWTFDFLKNSLCSSVSHTNFPWLFNVISVVALANISSYRWNYSDWTHTSHSGWACRALFTFLCVSPSSHFARVTRAGL